MIDTAALYIGAAALIALALTANVSRLRFKHRAPVGLGSGPEGEIKELRRAVRAHGNFIENAPLLLLALAALELGGAGAALLHAVGALTLFGRLGHAAALLRSGPLLLRFASVLSTWAAYLLSGALLLTQAF